MEKIIKKTIQVLGITFTLFLLSYASSYSFDKSFYRDEIRKDSSRYSYRTAQGQELKSTDAELGKSIVSVTGTRSRFEECLILPAGSVLLTKKSGVVDTLFAGYNFRDLPLDLSAAGKHALGWHW